MHSGHKSWPHSNGVRREPHCEWEWKIIHKRILHIPNGKGRHVRVLCVCVRPACDYIQRFDVMNTVLWIENRAMVFTFFGAAFPYIRLWISLPHNFAPCFGRENPRQPCAQCCGKETERCELSLSHARHADGIMYNINITPEKKTNCI